MKNQKVILFKKESSKLIPLCDFELKNQNQKELQVTYEGFLINVVIPKNFKIDITKEDIFYKKTWMFMGITFFHLKAIKETFFTTDKKHRIYYPFKINTEYVFIKSNWVVKILMRIFFKV